VRCQEFSRAACGLDCVNAHEARWSPENAYTSSVKIRPCLFNGRFGGNKRLHRSATGNGKRSLGKSRFFLHPPGFEADACHFAPNT
jgi:hypothetical protein